MRPPDYPDQDWAIFGQFLAGNGPAAAAREMPAIFGTKVDQKRASFGPSKGPNSIPVTL